MSIWQSLTSNYIVNVGVVAFFSAQLLKTIFTLLATKKLDMERMVGAGGFPSSHSALTCSVAIAVAKKLSFSSPEFGIALTLAAIVMYDAMGVRRAAGEQAKVLNKMIFEFSSFPFFLPSEDKDKKKEKAAEEAVETAADSAESGPLLDKELKEYLGHTPFEVLGGCLLGILISMFMPVT